MKAFALLLVVLAVGVSAENWAVLVAGSRGFWNYRHQADVCHAYQVLRQNGYPAERIITFLYDDVANNNYNPVKGKLFNRPSGSDHQDVDVYAGCQIDYSGNDVTPANFLAVLRGDAAATNGKKVLQTGQNDNIFINFSDHGAPGLIAFPTQYLYAKDLHPTFQYMYDNNKYAKVVFYLEACESGSMFQDLPTNLNIYAISAASPSESSWGYYCPPQDKVGGVSIGSCLGDLFSINWMEDSDKGDMNQSLQTQYETIKRLTTKSQVMQWGDLSFVDEPIGHYQQYKFSSNFFSFLRSYIDLPERDGEMWDSRNNKLMYLINRFKNTQAPEDFLALQEEVEERQYFDAKFTALQNNMNLTGTFQDAPQNSDCLQMQIENFEQACGKLTDYSLKYVKFFAEMCDNSNMLTLHMKEHIDSICDF